MPLRAYRQQHQSTENYFFVSNQQLFLSKHQVCSWWLCNQTFVCLYLHSLEKSRGRTDFVVVIKTKTDVKQAVRKKLLMSLGSISQKL